MPQDKFSETIVTDLVRKSMDDMDRTVTLIPDLQQRASVYHGLCAVLLDRAAAIRASEDKTDKRTAAQVFIRLLQKQMVGG